MSKYIHTMKEDTQGRDWRILYTIPESKFWVTCNGVTFKECDCLLEAMVTMSKETK